MQKPNQFSQSVTKGQLDLRMSTATISCVVDKDEAEPLVPGQAVAMVDSKGGAPKVTAVADDDEAVFGYVAYNPKQSSFAASEALEVCAEGSVLYLEAGGAIGRGGKVMALVAGEKVLAAGGDKPISGIAFDKADADGELIRVFVKSFGLLVEASV